MNYDRFLTRVWDKQEKKMFYLTGGWSCKKTSLIKIDNKEYEAISIRAEEKQITYNRLDNDGDCLKEIDIGDRFIPMQCTGFKEDLEFRGDGILIYEFDIIKTHVGVYLLVKLRSGCWIAESLDHKYSVDLSSLEGRYSICGNKFQTPELLKESK